MELAVSAPLDPDDSLASVQSLRILADRLENDAVARAIDDGWAWSEVAAALGVSRQAVHKKHSKRVAERSE